MTGSTGQPTITWMVNGAVISSNNTKMVSGITGSDGSYSNTLMFSPLRASDAGTFTCRAILGDASNSQTYTVAVLGECMYGNCIS